MNEYCVDEDEFVPPSSLKSCRKMGIIGERSIMTSASKNKVFNSNVEDLVDSKIMNVTVLAAKKKQQEKVKFELKGKITNVGEEINNLKIRENTHEQNCERQWKLGQET